MRRYIVKTEQWIEHRLRLLCGRITPERRLAVLLTMFVIFGITSLYIFVSAIYQIGKSDGEKIEIEHINPIQLESEKDTINQLNLSDYGRE